MRQFLSSTSFASLAPSLASLAPSPARLRATAAAASCVLVGSLAACGSSGDVDLGGPSNAAGAIINGEFCGVDDSPTAVAILIDATISLGNFGDQEIKTVICTGTLIAPDTVLTAAHCLDSSSLTFGFGDVTSEEYSVTFDDDLVALAAGAGGQGASVSLPEDRIVAAAYYANDQFSLDNLQAVDGPGDFFDIGVLFLSEAVDVQPEIVITAEEATQIVEGAVVSIAGWGQQIPTSGGPFEAPPEGSVGQKVCAQSFINEVGPSEFQVGGDSTTSRKCHGDSGGPTYMEIETDLENKTRVIGITSHAYDAEDCAKGGIDTRIDAYLPWLEDKMVGACEDGTRAWCDVTGVIPPSFYEPAIVVDPEPTPDGEVDDDVDVPMSNLIGGCSAAGPHQSSTPLFGAFILLALLGVTRRRR